MQQPVADAEARFDRTISRWFRDLLEMDPEQATYLGIHDHDHRLSDGGRDHVDHELAFHRATIAEMERFDTEELSPDRALDRDLVIHESRLAAFQLAERRSWAGASNAAEHLGNALFPIFTRDYAPLPTRLNGFLGYLRAIPRLAAEIRAAYRTESLDEALGFIEKLKSSGDGGSVGLAGPFIRFGNLVILEHGANNYSLYGYLETLEVERGAFVDAGAELGHSGSAPAGPPALYFEMRIDGRSVDPLQWLRAR